MSTLPRVDYGPLTPQRCVQFVDEHQLLYRRLAGPDYTLDWCVAMYNIGASIGSYDEAGISGTRCFHALSSAAAGVRFMLHDYIQDNLVEQQLLKRLFWLLFASAQYVKWKQKQRVNLQTNSLCHVVGVPICLDVWPS
jgi:hypothetical protein